MVELKREYVVPLRRKTNVVPKWRRSKKAVSVLNDFVKKHMKTDNVVICSELNNKIWQNGIKNPPGKVSVIALKTEIKGVEKTFVNLLEVGVENHLKSHNLVTPVVKAKKTKVEDKKDTKTEVKDAEVKEVKSETKADSKETSKKEESKK